MKYIISNSNDKNTTEINIDEGQRLVTFESGRILIGEHRPITVIKSNFWEGFIFAGFIMMAASVFFIFDK